MATNIIAPDRYLRKEEWTDKQQEDYIQAYNHLKNAVFSTPIAGLNIDSIHTAILDICQNKFGMVLFSVDETKVFQDIKNVKLSIN